MSVENYNPKSCKAVESISTQFSEDPQREPHEKETGFHVEGDGAYFSVTSFKKVVYSKLLQRPEFSVKCLHVLDGDGRQGTVDCLSEAAEENLTIIGVTGQLPVGALNIGTPRNSNSHADLVK
ncbi:hypothetical protein NDI54_08610 [Haloarcula sp. S1AR25-5A]|uniref:Uncharacterized protein n=1 Tax=Haloarcula terrestris TaxID=2950533 RepID=A0AAE4EWP6_9EURY|nr:hypothetical protein [Haloarcula terrestris]MDS0221408.1 hypothetical protein [Haloarcula terrestris]